MIFIVIKEKMRDLTGTGLNGHPRSDRPASIFCFSPYNSQINSAISHLCLLITTVTTQESFIIV
jgi:hypothetical protein